MRFNANEHYDQLRSLKENEDLRTLDVDTIKLRIEKIEELKKMLNKDLERSDCVQVAHIGIQIASEDGLEEQEPQRKKNKKQCEKPNVPSVSLLL